MTLKEKFELMKARGKNAILYFDMDGVLAKWKFAPLDETAEPGFFYNLDLEPSVRDAILMLTEAGFHTSILSASYHSLFTRLRSSLPKNSHNSSLLIQN